MLKKAASADSACIYVTIAALAEPGSDIIAAIVTTTVFMAKFNGILEHKK